MFESLVSRLTSPPAGRRSREVQSDPEECDATAPSVPRRGRASKLLLDKRRRARRSYADISAPVIMSGTSGTKQEVQNGHALRPSKSLGRLDGMKEVERLAHYERLVGGGGCNSDLDRIQELFPNDYLALYEPEVGASSGNTNTNGKIKTLLRKRPSLDLGALAASLNSSPLRNSAPSTNQSGGRGYDGRRFLMEAPCQFSPVAQLGMPVGGASPSGGGGGSGASSGTQDRHLFLFTDLLLVAKPRGGSFKLKECVRLSHLWVQSAPHRDTGALLGWARGSDVTTVLASWGTQAARDTWLRGLQGALHAVLVHEPPTTNIQIVYKEPAGIDYIKTLSVGPEITSECVVRQALNLFSLPPSCASDLCLAVCSRDGAPLQQLSAGCERPHAIQMSQIRQQLCSEEGFDLRHVNSRNNPCGLVFELRGFNRNTIKRTPLKLFRRSSGRLFGVSLSSLCAPLQGLAPPPVLAMLRALHIRGPLTQGIFRKSANARALREIRDKMDSMGSSGDATSLIEAAPVILVAALLKDFLRSLPNPLLCASLYDNWLRVLDVTSVNEKLSLVRSLLLQLPQCHLSLLSQVLSVLNAVARRSSVNLMCASNLGVCVGPSLLWPPGPPTPPEGPRAVPSVVEVLITHADELFHAIRHSNGNGNEVPDSGAEESDSLHSVGLSMDSIELSCVRKEKLSLSRDSGLTLSEDDSTSTGGQSPALRSATLNQQSMFFHSKTQQQHKETVRTFVPHAYVRAKSSNDLLENTTPSYSRVYGGWEQRISNYTRPVSRQNIASMHIVPLQVKSQNESSFKRRDWARQASRTKSNENGSTDSSQDGSSGDYGCRDKCQQRSVDPSHICCRNMNYRNVDTNKLYYGHYTAQEVIQPDYSATNGSTYKHRPISAQFKITKSNTCGNIYTTSEPPEVYGDNNIYGGGNSNPLYENALYENVYASRVKTYRAPPVPPRRANHNLANAPPPLKHLPPVQLTEERIGRIRSRSQTAPLFRPLATTTHIASVVALQPDTDTESESYV